MNYLCHSQMSNPRQCHKPYTSKDKWIISIMSGLLFLLVASPYLYNIVNWISTSTLSIPTAIKGNPNLLGLLIHGLIFTIVVRLMMR